MKMTDRPKGIWEDIWDDSIKWVRRLPLYFRLTHLPIIGKYLFRDTYVGDPNSKAWMLPVHEDIAQPRSAHLPIDVVRPLIEKAASRAKSARCICRVGFECQDYPHEDACVFLGSAFNNPDELGLVPLTVEEAVTHVEDAIEKGLVPTIIWEREIVSIFGARQETGLAICLCCDCCCDYRLGLRLGTDDFRSRVFRPEGVSLVVGDDCALCGDCAEPEVCSVSAITLGRVKSEIDLDMCVGCGHCVATCPNNAISFELDPQVDVVGKLMAHVEAFVDVT
jgi:UDP-glucose 4-epimerase